MPDNDQINRIAETLNILRPDWPTRSLVTLLTRDHANRPYRDLLIAAVAVAVDERTVTPARLAEHGPWWVAAYQASRQSTPTVGPGAEPRCGDHPQELQRHCRCCRSEAIAPKEKS
jgi:hypothetical protein